MTLEATDRSWADANGADIDRFCYAASESLLPRSCDHYDQRSTAWPIVSIYYTGFYLTLALHRILGRGLLYLNADERTALAAASGSGIKLQRGTYSLRIELSTRAKLHLRKEDVGGFHEGFWNLSDRWLAEFAEEISRGDGASRSFPPELRADALLAAEAFRDWIGGEIGFGRNPAWMSAIRNEVSYRLSRDVWGPNYRTSATRVQSLRREILRILGGRQTGLKVADGLDEEVRSMIERVATFYRDFAKLSDFPAPRDFRR